MLVSGRPHIRLRISKNQLFRTLDDVNPIPELQQLEEYVLENANKLGIGTMGFGGETTLLGCKIGVYNRLPASFYVSVAYNCWAYRRLGVTIHPETGEIMDWLYQEGDDTLQQEAQEKQSNVRLYYKHQLQKSKFVNFALVML